MTTTENDLLATFTITDKLYNYTNFVMFEISNFLPNMCFFALLVHSSLQLEKLVVLHVKVRKNVFVMINSRSLMLQ